MNIKQNYYCYQSQAMDALTCPKCGVGITVTGSALKFGHETSLTSDLGARTGAKNVVILIAEGKGSERKLSF